MQTVPDPRLLAANRANAAGQLEEVKRICQELLSEDPFNVAAKVLLGTAEVRSDNALAGIERLQEALGIQPKAYDAYVWLSIGYRALEQFQEAVLAAERAVELRPSDARAINNLGLCQRAAFQLESAAATFEQAIAIAPNETQILTNLGLTLELAGRFREAVKVYEDSLALQRTIEALLGLGRVMIQFRLYERAEECAKGALALSGTSLAAKALLADSLINLEQHAKAREILSEVLTKAPNDWGAHSLIGQSYEREGNFDRALDSFRKSVALQPHQGMAYRDLAHCQKMTPEDRLLITQMESVAESGLLAKSELLALEFAIAKSFNDLGQYDKAMRHYDEANRLAYDIAFRGKDFDREQLETSVNWTLKFFNEELFERCRGIGSDSEKPIFIFGMIRSGTTLIEQILASHPNVAAGGEINYWLSSGVVAFNMQESKLIPEKVKELAEQYLKLIERIGSVNERVTDKMPANLLAAGLIHLAFPNAHLIQARRNPVDVALSIYMTPNGTLQTFSYKKANIVFGSNLYERLMAHWLRVLPPARFTEVCYEKLVSNQESETRRLLEFCDLPWDDRCLRPEETERTVATPSLWQVRQPVYHSSIEKWRRYEPWLGEFAELIPKE